MPPVKPRATPPAKTLRPRNEQQVSKTPSVKVAAGAIHGLHPVATAWTNPERTCHRLLVTESAMEALAPALETATREGLSRPAPILVAKADLDRAMPGAVHQGAALEAAPLPERDIDDLLRMTEGQPNVALVVLDQVTDPHNTGAILRSAAAFGAVAVVVTERHAPEVTGTLAKAASGALEVVPLVRVTNLSRALESLKAAGFWCFGFAESGTRRLSEVDLSGRTALVLGAEGPGLRRLTMERCDELVRLPTSGPIGALNVSNAAAVALYEIARNRPEPA